MQDDEELTLDSAAISSRDSKTGVSLLSSLSSRRMTLSELSQSHGLSKPTVSKHLSKLERSGFVNKLDSERKWKYYELTSKGRAAVTPDSRTRLFFLTLALLLAMTVFLFTYRSQIERPISDLAAAILPQVDPRNPLAIILPAPTASPTPTPVPTETPQDIPPLPSEDELPTLPIEENDLPSLPESPD